MDFGLKDKVSLLFFIDPVVAGRGHREQNIGE
jgi:hypothetical protein